MLSGGAVKGEEAEARAPEEVRGEGRGVLRVVVGQEAAEEPPAVDGAGRVVQGRRDQLRALQRRHEGAAHAHAPHQVRLTSSHID